MIRRLRSYWSSSRTSRMSSRSSGILCSSLPKTRQGQNAHPDGGAPGCRVRLGRKAPGRLDRKTNGLCDSRAPICATFIHQGPPHHRGYPLDVRRTKIHESRILFRHELPEADDTLSILDSGGRCGRLLAPHPRAYAHGRSINHISVILKCKQASPAGKVSSRRNPPRSRTAVNPWRETTLLG